MLRRLMVTAGAAIGVVVLAAGCSGGGGPDDGGASDVIAGDVAAADAVAEGIIEDVPSGTCVDPIAVDLGVLVAAGPWSEICVYGAGGESSSVGFAPTGDGPWLLYSGEEPIAPTSCHRRIEDQWWQWYSADSDPEQPCAAGWTFQGA